MAEIHDKYDLQRFVTAQDPVYGQVCSELRRGRKEGHWMWFIFPQLRGLGHTAMAMRFGIESLAEARAYLNHPVLGPRLEECTRLVLSVDGRTVSQIFGYPDDLKFRSSMTLFAHAAGASDVFRTAIDRHYDGAFDALTVKRFG